MLGLVTAPGVSPQPVAERLAAHACVVYILWVSGRRDLLVELVCDAEAELAEFLNRRIYGQTDIDGVEVMTRLGMFKN